MRRDTHPVRGVVHVEPVVRIAPCLGRSAGAHGSAKISAPPPGSEPRPRILQHAQHVFVRAALEHRHVVDLGGRVELEMHVGQRRAPLTQYRRVELEIDMRVLAVDAVDLGEVCDRVLLDRGPRRARRR